MQAYKGRLKEISNTFFSKSEDYGAIFSAARAYKELLLEVSEFTENPIPQDETVYTISGKAIGPTYASMCVDDVFRTYKYVLGIYNAVQKLREERNEKIHILYAGTGPFATLLLPLTTVFSPEEVCFTLIEINEKSFEILQRTFQNIGLQAYVSNYINADATTLQLENPETIDVLVIEAMMHSLKSEQQVAISYNLIPQLSPQVQLIPEQIELHLLAVHADKRNSYKLSIETDINYFDRLGILFTLDKASILLHSKHYKEVFPNYIFPATATEIPENVYNDFTELSIETHIKIFEEITLGIDESGLTTLLKLYPIDPMKELGDSLVTKYICGKNPRLQCKLL